VEIEGAVQGIGFRPHVHRLALRHDLSGWVRNTPEGVTLEVEGGADAVQTFLRQLETERPPLSSIHHIRVIEIAAVGIAGFHIHASATEGRPSALILPDIATCSDCVRELLDPQDRRHRYSFINCTHCGPRFTIIDRLPYDRANTSMREFTMCPECAAEYDDPRDRRFHAQPNACHRCGPHVALWNSRGEAIATHDKAIHETVRAVREGMIVAVKGLGGIQLLVNAVDEEAIQRLRARKNRDAKPFAVMIPSIDVAATLCRVSALERDLLQSPEAPIVLLPRREERSAVADAVAPENPWLGLMLPHSPLHHLLLADLATPVVATSGNHSDEPICFDEREALERLAGIADLLLVHNRAIRRHADDSVVRVVCGEVQVLRRARGYAPLPIRLGEVRPPAIAFGAHQKSCIAITVGRNVVLSQHLGDMDTAESCATLRRTQQELCTLHDCSPSIAVCDSHPDYESTRIAEETGLPLQRVQHHIAHVLSCMAENGLAPPLLGVSWDGTGWGFDRTVWGGEFFGVDSNGVSRVAHLRTFPLPGGERAVREPRRSALGVLLEMAGDRIPELAALPTIEAFNSQELDSLTSQAIQTVNAPRTSSAGRLFDAVASLIGLRHRCSFEGQAAMDLEFAAKGESTAIPYPHALLPQDDGALIIDWAPCIEAILQDSLRGTARAQIAARFHLTLAEIIVSVARRLGHVTVALTGGCFQSRLLTELTVRRLREEGFAPHWHRRVPPNDGGIALGQIAALQPAREEN
jgi:hydrogenase maturation protein HypF